MTGFAAGVFLVDKPVGPSSFTMVRQLRRLLGIKKVGHAGTLDPFASGLLVICAGRPATKMISSLMAGEKQYLATLCLGRQTTTLDPEGEIVEERVVGMRTAEEIEACLARFRGEQWQRPPAYSAVKHKGKPLYHYARKGIEITKEPRRVEVTELVRLDDGGALAGDFPQLRLKVRCSKGTYIRVLAADIGEALGCGAYLQDLRRTASGLFSVESAIPGELLPTMDDPSEILPAMLSVEKIANLLQ
ncbi:MAG: tRNA pseudouridine(55) synthase TruB [Desulfopila sp.]